MASLEEQPGDDLKTALKDSGATGRSEMGTVMKIVQEQAAGRVDGKTLSQPVMTKLT